MTNDIPAPRLAAEQRSRAMIDEQLRRAGWIVQDKSQLNLFAGDGVACREVTMASGHGRVDYLLFIDRRVVGLIEAKPAGTTLSGVEWQTSMYAVGLPAEMRGRSVTVDGRLPFVFEASGAETHFTNGLDPSPRARRIFNFPQPQFLIRLLRDLEGDAERPTWRAKVNSLPPLDTEHLRPAQIEAVTGIERSLKEQRFDRSLIQMATGAGKTFTAITSTYRLLHDGGFSRVLFLVDRNNLADQTLAEFQNYRTPGDGRRFTELYNVDKLSSAGMLDSSNVVISTIQRVFSVLGGGEALDQDDPELDGFIPVAPVTVEYNPAMPPESFDLVIVDEAHRSIYGSWRGVLDYFDAHVIGLTATPGKQTFAFFRQNLVSEYTYPQSVADRVNVDFDIFRIRTEISENGASIEAGTIVPMVDRRTRMERLESLDESVDYTHKQLDRAVTSKSQIRTVLETYRDLLFTDIFPGRSVVPKTLIFAKDDAHAEEIVVIVRQVFGKGNEFAAKITYAARNAKQQLQAFRTSPQLRIAVTVDMIATGTDVKPLECVFFMRDVQSAQYFEQMKGRGARTVSSADFRAVTPDASAKTRFVIVDAVGVTEHKFVDPPLNRDRAASLKSLLSKAATLTLTEDETATLASRLAKLELELTADERAELDAVAEGSVRDIVRGLVDAVNSDIQVEYSKNAQDPGVEIRRLMDAAIMPIAANPDLRSRILELRATHDRLVDEVNRDVLIGAYGVVDPDRAQHMIDSWRSYLDEHRDEISAIQILQEAGEQRIAFSDIRELADRIARPPYNWTSEILWEAYASLDANRVRKTDRHTMTDLVSLLRFTVGLDDDLVPFADRVRERYIGWLAQQEQSGTRFTVTERWWLDRMMEVIAASAGISADDLDESPFLERGGVDGILRDFGDRAVHFIDELNTELTA